MLIGHFVVPVEAGLAGTVLLAVHLGLSTWEALATVWSLAMSGEWSQGSRFESRWCANRNRASWS
jgi:hypothetical protein